MFPNRIKKGGTKMKPGPMRYEEILARRIQPVADSLGLPHITWRLLRHWGSSELIEKRVDPKVMQQRLGHSRPDIVMRHYAHVLDENADRAADLISGKLGYVIPAEFAENPVEV
jgi:integrase